MKAVFLFGAVVVATLVATTPAEGRTVTADELIQALKFKRQAKTTPKTGGGGPPTTTPSGTGGGGGGGGSFCLNYMQTCQQGGKTQCCNGDCITLLDAETGLCLPKLEG